MGFEFAFLDFIQENLRSAPMDSFMVFITSLGKGGLIWFLVAAVCLPFRRTRRVGVCIIIAVAVAYLIAGGIIKNIVDRPRPFEVAGIVQLLIDKPSDTSFPSGHTATAFATVGVLWAAWRDGRKAPTGLFVVVVVLACLMVFSRMYLYVHFPTDILAGALIGLIVGWITWKVSCRIAQRRKKTANIELEQGGSSEQNEREAES